MLFVLVVRLSVCDVRDVHHCGDTWNVWVNSFSTFRCTLNRTRNRFFLTAARLSRVDEAAGSPAARTKLLNYSSFAAFRVFPGSGG